MSATPTFAMTPADLLALGYWPGVPTRIPPAAARVDRQACARAKCGRCRHQGLDCLPFHKDKSYRVLAVCPSCSFCEEV